MGPCGGGGWTLVMKMNGTKVTYPNKEMIFADELQRTMICKIRTLHVSEISLSLGKSGANVHE